MKSHGILMSDEMVCAYLAGLKTQTRRTRGLDKINMDPSGWRCEGLSINGQAFVFSSLRNPATPQARIQPPYGSVGDELWFREAWAVLCRNADPYCWCETDEERKVNHYVEYRADTGNKYPGEWPEEEARGNDEAPKWKSSLYMPRGASRITTSITSVRVERLQDITPEDAFAEGVRREYLHQPPDWMDRDRYKELWNSLNAQRGMNWERNPWVWVYEFPCFQAGENSINKENKT